MIITTETGYVPLLPSQPVVGRYVFQDLSSPNLPSKLPTLDMANRQVAPPVLIGTATIKSVGDLQTKCREWDLQFRSGDKGIFVINFPIPLPRDIPNWFIIFGPLSLGAGTSAEISKVNIAKQVKGLLAARGVTTWRDPEWVGSDFKVYYTVGIAPLVIAVIVVGALIGLGIIAITISNYKIQEIEVQAYNDRQRLIDEAFIDAVNEVEDPADRAKLLNDRSESAGETYRKTATPSIVEAGAAVLEKPALVIGIGIAAFFVVLAIAKFAHR